MLYVSPEHPPPCTPKRKPPVSGDTSSLAMALRMRVRAFGVTSMPRPAVVFGLVTVVLIIGSSTQLWSAEDPSLSLRFDGCRRCGALLLLPVANGGTDSVFRQHRTMDLYRRQR